MNGQYPAFQLKGPNNSGELWSKDEKEKKVISIQASQLSADHRLDYCISSECVLL